MFKLLTDEARDKIKSEYATRRVIVVFLSLILVLVVGIIGLLPSYILSSARENEANERTKIVSLTSSGEDGEALRAWLVKTNLKLNSLNPKLDVDRPSKFIDNLLGYKISGISITGLSWVKVKDKLALSVSGVALDRQTLVRFENLIKSSEHFSNVTLPISDLAKDKNITFQIRFSPK